MIPEQDNVGKIATKNESQFLSIQSNCHYAEYCNSYVTQLISKHKVKPFSTEPITPQLDIAVKLIGDQYMTDYRYYATPYVVIVDIPKQFDHVKLPICSNSQIHGRLSKPVFHIKSKFNIKTKQKTKNKKFCMREILSSYFYPFILITTTYVCSKKKCNNSIVSHATSTMKQLSLIQQTVLSVIITKKSAMCVKSLLSVVDELQLHVIITKCAKMFAVKRHEMFTILERKYILANSTDPCFPRFLIQDNTFYIQQCVYFYINTPLFKYYLSYNRRLNAKPDDHCYRKECIKQGFCWHHEISFDFTYNTSTKEHVIINNAKLKNSQGFLSVLHNSRPIHGRFVNNFHIEQTYDILDYQEKQKPISTFFVDNCCDVRDSLEQRYKRCKVSLDLWHASQRPFRDIPSTSNKLRKKAASDLKSTVMNYSEKNNNVQQITDSPKTMRVNFNSWHEKYKGNFKPEKYFERNCKNLANHISKGCLSGISYGTGMTSVNEACHGTINKQNDCTGSQSPILAEINWIFMITSWYRKDPRKYNASPLKFNNFINLLLTKSLVPEYLLPNANLPPIFSTNKQCEKKGIVKPNFLTALAETDVNQYTKICIESFQSVEIYLRAQNISSRKYLFEQNNIIICQ